MATTKQNATSHQSNLLNHSEMNQTTLIPATNIQIATHVSLPVKVMSNADGVKEEPLTTRMRDKPNSSAVVTRKESHTSSPAQETSRPKTAQDTTATGPTSPVNSPKKDNSQMSKHAKTHAKHQNHGRNATTNPRNVKTANKENQNATLMLSVKPVATSPWVNAMTPPDNAKNAPRTPIQTALNQWEHANQDARSLTTPRLYATRPQENA